MPNSYIAYNFLVKPRDPATEILVAELSDVGFESFVETEKGVVAYLPKKNHDETILQDIFILKNTEFSITYSIEEIEEENWNSAWEKNFEPIQVNEQVSVRAPFHNATDLPYEIVIEPKMSFGTGHHETTHMMIQHLLKLKLDDKRVLDMGCGTGILAIFAEKKGAAFIDAIDIDTWCYQNSLENIRRNNCKKINVFKGDTSLLINKKFDIIIANINRNVLLNDLKSYVNCLNENGVILLSGFYQEDIPIIDNVASKFGLKIESIIEKNNWVAIRYQS